MKVFFVWAIRFKGREYLSILLNERANSIVEGQHLAHSVFRYFATQVHAFALDINCNTSSNSFNPKTISTTLIITS